MSKRADRRSNSPARKGNGARPAATSLAKVAGTPGKDADSCPVVGLGASAGGLEALREFFEVMPPDSGMAFVVIQHLDPTHKSHMRDVLARYTKMTVVEPADQTPIEPNVVYTIPPNTYIAVRDSHLALSEPVKRAGMRMPIDFFLRSLAADRHENAIGILFSGSGTDGTLGVREIRGGGGIVLVQDPETAQYDSMPHSAIFAGLVDQVLKPHDMPASLIGYAQQRYTGDGRDRALQEQSGDLHAILALVVGRTKSDFRAYKKATIHRRILRQMALNKIENLHDYLAFLRSEPDKVTELAKDMLIGVTSFFRDPDTFEELRRSVIVPLIENHDDDAPIRVWVPGCATGEEAYSIAILILEELAAAEKSSTLHIFASDVDEDALKVGRTGAYPETIASDISEERLSRFFTKSDRMYQVNRYLREKVTFAAQNLITDPPFSRIDLISCRNVLIYFESDIQRRVVALFGYALNPRGYLFLGKSDGVAGQSDLFESVASKLRIFRRTIATRPDLAHFSTLPDRAPFPGRTIPLGERPRGSPLSHIAQQALLKHFKAATVLVDRHGTILNFLGHTGRYLDHPSGDASLNLFQMTREALSVKLSAALRDAAHGETVVLQGVSLRRGDELIDVDITVHPVSDRKTGEYIFAVVFEEPSMPPAPPTDEPSSTPPSESGAHALLVDELASAKEDLQSSIEELETSNEELRAANEEVTSINEELQSTNEELETSKEELQSLNEELSTVNSHLQEKVDELGDSNSDLANLFAATDIATVFLDLQMRVRRFTPALTQFMRLITSDIGRPIEDISHQLIGVDLVAIGNQVLRDLRTVDCEVQGPERRWFEMKVTPYRTLANKIDGVLVMFHEVTQRRATEKALRRMKERMQRQAERTDAKLAETTKALQEATARREELRKKLLRFQEDERQRIARELHDSTAQNLAGLNVNLALIERASKELPPKVRHAVSESSELIYAVTREVRTLSYLLHPPLLEEVGLVSAVRDYIEGFASRSGLQVTSAISRDLGQLPLAVKAAVFRIIQEALTNIHRHSGSRKAKIEVRRGKTGLRVLIEDAGRGLPSGILGKDGQITSKAGVGMSSMQERLRELGGNLRIRSRAGQTVLTATVPLRRGGGRLVMHKVADF